MVNNYALHNVETLRFWCRKVLPLVYDDSLSYYEVLCKVVAKLNEVIDNEDAQNEVIRQLSENVDTLAQAQTEQYNELLGMIDGAITSIGNLQTGKVDKAQSASDNGKVLCIVNGQVTPVEVQGGGSGVFYVEYGVTTITEIKNALDNDLMPVLMRNDESENVYGYLRFFDFDETPYAEFSMNGRYAIYIATVDVDSTWNFETYNYNQDDVYVVRPPHVVFTEIESAARAGNKVCIFIDSNGDNFYTLSYITLDTIIFSRIHNNMLEYVTVYTNNTFVESTTQIQLYNIGAQNAGKTLVANYLGELQPQRHFEVFPVTYNTTTYAEIAAALQNEMIPVMVYGDKTYVISAIDAIEITMTSCTPAGTYIAYVDTSNVWSNESKAYVQTAQGVANAGKSLTVNASGNVQAQMGIGYLDTAPSANNTNGLLIPVVLGENSDPATKYEGYLYIIHEESIA